MADTKPCPYCKETIAVSAKKCRFCNEWLDAGMAAKNRAPAGASQFAACPNCRLQHAVKVNWTWWGGLLGPRIFNHVECKNCGTTYNGTSGKSNNTAIAIYTMVGLGLGLAIVVLIAIGSSH